jgi:hypothetical protein
MRPSTHFLTASLMGCFLCSACASTALERLSVHVTPGLAVARLTDLKPDIGVDHVVYVSDGRVVRGRLEAVSDTGLRLRTTGDAVVSFSEPEIGKLGVVRGVSRRTRTWIGTAAGVLLSLPLSISTTGDMMVPGALIGAVMGRLSGDARVVIVFERIGST